MVEFLAWPFRVWAVNFAVHRLKCNVVFGALSKLVAAKFAVKFPSRQCAGTIY
jgi:hypothetical protein